MKTNITEYILSQIGLSGSRRSTNVAGWTDAEIAALPPGTRTTVAYGGGGSIPDMSMPVSDLIGAGYSIRNIVSAIRKSQEKTPNGNTPSLHVVRHRKLDADELAKVRKGYISEEAADEYAHPEKIWSCPVDLADIRPTDRVSVHYPYVG